MKRSISFVKGSGNVNHNNREFNTKNVDVERSSENITYVKEDLKDAYEQEFGASVEDYNAKQIRNDRKIGNYMEQIEHSKNGEKLFYENVVQVGDMTNMSATGKHVDTARAILDQYAKEFQQRNPNLHVFNMVLHMDEATPHLHIDYIPVGEGYKNGLNKRASLSKAFENMGFSGNKQGTRFENSTLEWQAREKGRIEQIMQEHGIEREDKGIKRGHLTNTQYQAMVEVVDKRMAKIEEIPVTREIKGKMFSSEVTEVAVPIKEYKKANKTLKSVKVKAEALDALKEQVEQKQGDLLAREQEIKVLHEKARQELIKLTQERSKYEGLVKEQSELNKDHQSLTKQYNAVIRQNDTLSSQYKELKEKVKDLVEPYKSEIKELNDKVIELHEKVEDVYTSLANTTKAIGMLKYDEGEYKANLTDQQERLIDGIREYNVHWMEQDGFKEMAEDIQQHVGISKGIRNHIIPDFKEIYYRKGEQGFGFYASKAEGGQHLGSKSDLSALKKMFPNAQFNDKHDLVPELHAISWNKSR